MFEALFLIGLIAFLVCIVMLFIKIARKQSAVIWGIGMLVSFAVFVVGITMMSNSDHPPASSMITQQPTTITSNLQTSTQTPTQTTTPSPTTPIVNPAPTPPPSQVITVHYIDVGQGDSILVDLGDLEVLIDGGSSSLPVINYLNSYVDGALEVMVATHTHADHIGGLIDVLAKYQVKDIWLNGDTATSVTYLNFMNLVNNEGAIVHQAERGNTIQVGALKFVVLNPAKPLFSDANNNSIVLSFSYGDVDFLFTGDTEQEAEGKMMIQSVVTLPDCEILKVGHHGSRTASSPPFLSLVKPNVAIYSCGIGNTYGHPHQETLANLDNIGAKIYGTDVHGSIVVSTDGKTYDVKPTNQVHTVKPPPTTPTPSPPPPESTPPPTSTPNAVANVQITKIFYDGLVPRTEADEYVEITNLGSESVDLKGWVLKDISEGYPSFTFPSYVLKPNMRVRVYTNEVHPEYGGFSFGRGTAIWNNSDPDTAALFNAQGQEVSRKSY